MNEYIAPLIELLNEMSPYLLLGFLIAGILHEFVPQKIYRGGLSQNNTRSVLLAALFGVPLPLCSCGVIPTAMSLRREGVSKGATTSFLISTPQTGADSILATTSLLGLPFALVRVVAAFVTAIIGGIIVNRFDNNEIPEETASRSYEKKRGFWKKCIGALDYGFIRMLQDIGKWIVIGLVVAGLITILVPDNFFTAYSNEPIANMFIVMLFAVPMYLCATGSIPIAAALMLKGLSPGAALVLLMAGPATNMAAILVIRKVMGTRTLFIYLTTIIIGAFCFGLAVDYMLPHEWFNAETISQKVTCCNAHGHSWWKTASSIIFALLLVVAFVMKYAKPHIHTTQQQIFHIKGMMCNHCKASVERSLAGIEGVTAVQVDLENGTAYVEGNFDTDAVISAIKSLGYECSEN